MRDALALWLIRAARKLTTWGFTDDYLADAEDQQSWVVENSKRDLRLLGRNPHHD